jgi:hypothetical protein
MSTQWHLALIPFLILNCALSIEMITKLSWTVSQRLIPAARTIFIADAHRDDAKRFVVHADEKVSAFVELERVTRESLRFSMPELIGTILAVTPLFIGLPPGKRAD